MNTRTLRIPQYSERQKVEVLDIIRTRRRIFHWVLNKFRDVDSSEKQDYLQEMYMKLWQQYPYIDMRRTNSLNSVIINICYHAVLIYRRRVMRRIGKSLVVYVDAVPDRPEIVDLDLKDDIARLHAAAASVLSDKYKAIFDLYLQGKTLKEIGELLGYSESAMHSNIDRVRQDLRRCLVNYTTRYQRRERPKNQSLTPVYQYDKDGNLVRKWACLGDVRDYGYEAAYACVKNEIHTCYGHIFSYNELTKEQCAERFNAAQVSWSKSYKPVDRFDLTGKFLKRYDSISQVQEDGFVAANVQACMSGRRPTHQGCLWKYADPNSECRNLEFFSKFDLPVEQITRQGTVMKKWPSIRSVEASGFDPISVLEVVTGQLKMHKAYLWRFADAVPVSGQAV